MTTLNVPAWVSPKEAERALEDARAMRSPLLMAERFSNGQWKRARHLAVVDFEFRNLLSDPNLDCLIIKMPVRHGKLLADETPIWTPDGWKTHGDLAVGSKVFAADGIISTVIGISEKQEADCEVVFSDGEVIKCHEAHEWPLYDRKEGRLKTVETAVVECSVSFGEEGKAYRWFIRGSNGPVSIREVRRVAPSPGHCIEIDHPSHLYLCGKTNKPTHNSEYLARWAPAWYLLRNPYRRVMICTNTSTLASSHSRWVRDKVHELGPMMGVPGVDPKHSSVKHWQIERAKGGCYAAGVGGSIVGFGADLLIIDDYLKDAKSSFSQKVRDDQWDWFVSTSGTRLEPGGKCVLLCTQWNSDDLIGRIEKRKDELDIRVRSITLQALREGTEVKDPLGRAEGEALWPERWPAEVMERRKRQAGHWWHSIYQGNPKGSSMANWPESYFSNIFADDVDFPEPTDCLISASFLDPSKGKNSRKGDYQAQIWIGYKNGLFFVDSDIERKPIPKMVRDFVLFNRERKTAFVGLEANAWQDLLADDYWEVCQDIEYNADKPELVNQTTNKTVRIERLGKWLNQRLLRFRKSASNELLIKQMQEFPYGQHDDGPDALEACMALLCRSVDALHGLHEVTETGA